MISIVVDSLFEKLEKTNRILPYNRGPTTDYLAHINQITASRRMVEDAEDTDANSEIHGFWTIETAKSRLHQYLQQHKINAEYKYTCTGPDNNR